MRVFVYGTLTNPSRATAVLGDSYQYRTRATIEGLHCVDGDYPTLAPGGTVTGRLLETNEHGLRALDRYEGVADGLYTRVELPLRTAGETSIEADSPSVQCYIGDPHKLGHEGRLSWPDTDPFEAAVRQTLSDRQIVVAPHE